MKRLFVIMMAALLAGCASQRTPEEQEKLKRMDKAMEADASGLRKSGVVNEPIGGGVDPAKGAIIDGSVEL